MLGFLSEDNFTCILFPSTAEHIKMKVKLTDFMIKIIKAFVILECSAWWVSYMRCLLLSSFIEIVHPKWTLLLFTYPYVILNMECCYFRFETQIEKTLCSSFHSDHICQAPKRGKKMYLWLAHYIPSFLKLIDSHCQPMSFTSIQEILKFKNCFSHVTTKHCMPV